MNAADFDGRPLLATSITGIRSFRVDALGRLVGVVKPQPWTPGENVAECKLSAWEKMLWPLTLTYTLPSQKKPDEKKKHEVAKLGCGCGFYAYFDKGHNPHHTQGNVLGLIDGYGLVTVGDRGFRASKARIVALIDEPPRHHWLRRLGRWFWATAGVSALSGAGLAAVGAHGWVADLFGFILGYALAATILTGVHALTKRQPRSTVPDHVRALYSDIPVYPSLAAALAEHPLTPPERPSPANDPDFWKRAS